MVRSALIRRQPEEIIAYVGGEPVTVDTFAGQVAGIAERLPESRFVLNLCEDRYRFLVGFAAALIRGQVTLLPVNRQPETLRRTRNKYPDACILDDEPDAAGNRIGVVGCPSGRPELAYGCMMEADRLCATAFTSGSTGEPKPIDKHWQTLAAGALVNHRHLVGDLGTVSIAATVPAQHMYGLETTVMLPLQTPVAVASERPLFPEDVRTTLAPLAEPRVLVSTPVHLRALVESGVAFPPVARVLSATAPLTGRLAGAVVENLGADMLEVFGFSEAGCVATRRTAREDAFTPFDAFRFQRRADGGWQVRADHINGPVPFQDLLEFDADGRFRLIGRASDMINIAGKRGSLVELNRRLLEIDGVADGVVFQPVNGSRGRLAALVVAPDLTVSAIRRELRAHFDPVFIPRPLLLVDELPRSASGKLPQGRLMAAFEDARKRCGR